jgi:hypothetical protein
MAGIRGHSLVRHGPGDWRCTCGTTLSGGPWGSGRAGARDVMRFHRMDLETAAQRDAAVPSPAPGTTRGDATP